MRRLRRPGGALTVAAFTALLILLGVLIWYRPHVFGKRLRIAGVPTPPALLVLTQYRVPAGSEACMSSITMEPDMGYAQFTLRPAKVTPKGGPPVEVVFRAAGYRATLRVPGGYPGGAATLPFRGPPRTEIGDVCFVDRGKTAVLLNGTDEPRTVATRTATTVGGASVAGDVALTFLAAKPSSPLEDLGQTFEHASNLTGRLIPAWLIWILAVLLVLFVPSAIVAAVYLSLRIAEPAGNPSAPAQAQN